MARPVLFVLAGVNGAGKSSVGGQVLSQAGLSWFNPDAFARELSAEIAVSPAAATARSWHEGVRRLDDAIRLRRNHAFETTLAGRTIVSRLTGTARSHDILMWYCGLASADLYVRRVHARVNAGGHDIPEAVVRARIPRSTANLIGLLPHLTHLHLYDNSAEVRGGAPIPDPVLVLEVKAGTVVFPALRDLAALRATPDWAKPIVEAALASRKRRR